MKFDYSNILLLAVASLSAPFSLSAANYVAEIDPTPLWSATAGCPAAASARSMAVSAGRVYTVNHTEKKVYYASEDGKWNSFAITNAQSANCMIASDEAGNLVIPFGMSLGTTTKKDLSFLILRAGATAVEGNLASTNAKFTIPAGKVSDDARIDYISASGNLFNSNDGGYIYLYVCNGETSNPNTLAKIKGSWGNHQSWHTIDLFQTDAISTSTSNYPKYVKGSDGEILIQSGNATSRPYLYKMAGTGESAAITSIDNNPYPTNLLSGTKVIKDNDRQFYVYASCSHNGNTIQNAAFTVKNVLTGETVSHSWNIGDSFSNGGASYGMWVDAEFADDNTIHVYCYMPGKGAWKYKVNLKLAAQAPAAPANAAATIVTQTSDQPGRQDAMLSWDAVDGAASYTVERKYGDSWAVIATGLTDCAYTDYDITLSFIYRVKAVSAAGIESDPSAELRCDPRFIPHAPEWEDLRVYDGYAKLQMLWKWTYGYRPDAYDILRDGEVIAKDIPVLNFIDRYIPTGNRKYEIASVYYKESGKQASGRRPETARSSIKVADVLPRNHANELYGITELYNYEITPGSPLAQSAVLPDFDDQNLYRQAAFYKGRWYIAQRQDNSDYAGSSSGGIVCIDANAGSAEAIAASAKKIYTIGKGSNVGIAVDDHGTFFIRDGAEGQYEFVKPVTSGRLLRFNDDLSVAVDKVIDLSGVADGGAKMTFRSDYYSVKGDALNGDAKLYLAPSQGGSLGSTGRNAWIIDINKGNLSASKVYDSHVEGDGGVENYIFPLDGRDDVLHLVRSNGFYRFTPGSDNSAKLYHTYSRANNAGGTSLWFNNHLLIITPQSQQSKNIGGFLVATGTPDPDKLAPGHTKAADPKDVIIDYEHIIPVVSVAQEKSDLIEAQNSNGLWFGLEPFYNDNGEPSHVDIYLYIPGLRVAKYRLYPFINLPVTEVEMNVDIQYEEDEHGNNIDITSFKGTATWPAIQFQGDYTLSRYNLQFLNLRNEVLEEHFFDTTGREVDADGNPVVSPRSVPAVVGYSDDGAPVKFSYSLDHLDSHEYQAKVTATYKSANDDRSWVSEPSVASDMTDYEPDAPLGQVKVIKESNVWSDKTDNSIMRRNYRIDIDFNAPEFNSTGVPYPVTYYELWYRKPGDAVGTFPNRLEDLAVMNGDSKAIEHQSVVPGTFDFNDSKRQVVKDQGIPVVCCHFHQPQVDSAGALLDSDEDPVNWNFVVRAKYAARARNTAIAKDRETEMVPTSGGTTGVDDIIDTPANGGEAVYPSLTDGPVTVTSNAPISTIAVYGVDGSLVMSVSANADLMLRLDLSRLHSGIYFVSVDGHPGHKIVKR